MHTVNTKCARACLLRTALSVHRRRQFEENVRVQWWQVATAAWCTTSTSTTTTTTTISTSNSTMCFLVLPAYGPLLFILSVVQKPNLLGEERPSCHCWCRSKLPCVFPFSILVSFFVSIWKQQQQSECLSYSTPLLLSPLIDSLFWLMVECGVRG